MNYIRLPGKRRGFFRRCTLWLGGDHLLAVDFNGYMESYKRFYLADIQAIITRKTSHGKIVTVVLTVLLLASLLPLIMRTGEGLSLLTVLLGIAASGFFLFLIIYAFKGPTCICHIKMPLATHELPSIQHLKQARKMMKILRPRVSESQGVLSEQEIREGANRKAAEWSTARTVPLSIRGFLPHQGEKEYGGTVHRLLFGLVVGDVALTLATFYCSNAALSFANWISGVGLFVLVIMALVKQRGEVVPSIVKMSSWIVLAVLIAGYVFSFGYNFFYALSNNRLEAFQDQYNMLSVMSEIRPLEHPLLAKALIGYMVIALICSVAGFTALSVRSRSYGKRFEAAPQHGARSAVEKRL